MLPAAFGKSGGFGLDHLTDGLFADLALEPVDRLG